MTAPLTLLGTVPTWHEDGLCQQVNPDLFYPERGQSPEPAKDICRRCPVKDKCLNWSLEKRERFGVWGGMSEPERQRLLSRKNKAVAA